MRKFIISILIALSLSNNVYAQDTNLSDTGVENLKTITTNINNILSHKESIRDSLLEILCNIEIDHSNLYKHFNFVTDKDKERTKTGLINELLMLDDKVKESFEDDGGTITVTSDGHQLIPEINNSFDEGYIRYRDLKIVISSTLYNPDTQVLSHELGHYIDYTEGFGRGINIQSIPKNEVYSLIAYTDRDYCLTNNKEFFAEAYRYYVHDNDDMLENMPETYRLVETLENKI